MASIKSPLRRGFYINRVHESESVAYRCCLGRAKIQLTSSPDSLCRAMAVEHGFHVISGSTQAASAPLLDLAHVLAPSGTP